ncbi:MAG: hypothetical protein EOO74_12550, partial [Myxococcales bacterium]
MNRIPRFQARCVELTFSGKLSEGVMKISRVVRAAWPASAITVVVLVGACADEVSSPSNDAGISNTEDGGSSDSGSAPRTCGDGTWDNHGCVPWSTCAPGTHVTNTPSATSDRTCAACASGTFSTTVNAESCTPWTTCSSGNHVSSPGSTIAVQQCAPCADGTYSSSPNQTTCLPAGACAAGTVQTKAGTATSAPVCASCEVGTHCAGGSAPKEPCASGTWDHDNKSATACVEWSDCVAGESVTADGTATTNRTCAQCASGTFSTTANAASCVAWSDCVAGESVTANGTATANRTCAPCASGTFSTTANS